MEPRPLDSFRGKAFPWSWLLHKLLKTPPKKSPKLNKTALNIFNESPFQTCLRELVVTITPSVISLCLELPPAPAKTLPAVDLGHLGRSQGFSLSYWNVRDLYRAAVAGLFLVW